MGERITGHLRVLVNSFSSLVGAFIQTIGLTLKL